MKVSTIIFYIASMIVFAACSGGSKKVMIMASGKITVSEKDPKSIQIQPGTRHTEQEITLEGGDKQGLTVNGLDAVKTFAVEENGHYILNLKPDTLVGGIVNYGAAGKSTNLTGEDVDRMIDSTRQLIEGKNASDDKKTYFIAPYSIKKVSTNAESRIIGPYNNIPGTVDAGSSGKPEVYKFFTNKQKRESLEDLIKERKK